MGICESGQGLTAAAISSRLFVQWASHPTSTKERNGDLFTAVNHVVCCLNARENLNRVILLERAPPVKSKIETEKSGVIDSVDVQDIHESSSGEAYKVVARRYRPQRFDELVGQEHVAAGLSGAIVSERIGHAYLFTGARGVGKTSAARIFAKALACVNGPAAEPCNKCHVCLAILAGQDIDVVEVDAASNRGIDEIRQLRQNVAVRPSRGRYKVYIIDEVHMLTREAFNALLKTLEEPPAHVKFVLCTTEPEKLPITILSRCQRYDFTNVDTPAIVRRLEQITEAEGVKVEFEALELIARRAAGSMRDSQSLLEQLLACAGGKKTGTVIDRAAVHAVLGTGREEGIGRLIEAIASHDAKTAVESLDAEIAGGADPGGVLEQLLGALRDSLLASVGCDARVLRQPKSMGVDLAALGRILGTETVLAMLQVIDQALFRMRSSGHASVLAEMTVVRLARLENLESIVAAVERLSSPLPAEAIEGPRRREIVQEPERVMLREKKVTPTTSDLEEKQPSTSHPSSEVDTEGSSGAIGQAIPATVQKVSEPQKPIHPLPTDSPADANRAWQQVGESLGGLAADFAAMSSGARWKSKEVLEIDLPASAGVAMSFLKKPEVSKAIGQVLEQLFGHAVKCLLATEDVPSTPVSQTASPRSSATQASLLREAHEHPFVAHARTLFDASVRRVDMPLPESIETALTSVPAVNEKQKDLISGLESTQENESIEPVEP